MKNDNTKTQHLLLVIVLITLVGCSSSDAIDSQPPTETTVQQEVTAVPTDNITDTTPLPQTPTGTITDASPIYTWEKVSGATHYQLQLRNKSGLIFTQRVRSSDVCEADTCSYAHETPLNSGNYMWRVRARVDVWGSWSAFTRFKLSA